MWIEPQTAPPSCINLIFGLSLSPELSESPSNIKATSPLLFICSPASLSVDCQSNTCESLEIPTLPPRDWNPKALRPPLELISPTTVVSPKVNGGVAHEAPRATDTPP